MTKLLTKKEELVWYITIKNNNKIYYVAEVIETHTVKWTVYRTHAIQINTKQGVQQFIHSFLKDRSDIFLMQAPPEDWGV